MADNQIEVSVIIVARNEARHIVACIESICGQFDKQDVWELILVDGLSEDDTKQLAKKTCKDFRVENFRIIDNPKKILAAGWNLGIKTAKGKLVVRPDAHAELYPGYIHQGVEVLRQRPEVACVGGVLITLANGFWGNIIKQALSSRAGVGNSSFRIGAVSGYQDTAVYGIYRKEVFEKVGFFNERLTRHQDNEFHQRVMDAGYKFWMDNKMQAGYYCRDSIKSLLHQMFKIGYYLPDLTTKNSMGGVRLRHLAPGLFFLAVTGAVLLGLFMSVFLCLGLGMFLFYLLLMLLNSIVISIKENGFRFLNLAYLIPSMHFAYFLGTLSGFIKKIFLTKQK
jgi:glycosyltransferase involved in cell wall biosynthesis